MSLNDVGENFAINDPPVPRDVTALPTAYTQALKALSQSCDDMAELLRSTPRADDVRAAVERLEMQQVRFRGRCSRKTRIKRPPRRWSAHVSWAARPPAGFRPRCRRGEVMEDLSSLTLSDVRHHLSTIILFYVEAMGEKSRGTEYRLGMAQVAEAALHRYLKLLSATEIVAELEQTQRLIGQWRSNLPQPFPDEDTH